MQRTTIEDLVLVTNPRYWEDFEQYCGEDKSGSTVLFEHYYATGMYDNERGTEIYVGVRKSRTGETNEYNRM